MTTPRRYVRVRMLTHYGTLASWSCRLCITAGGYWTAEVAHDHATKHARECEAIRIATERDQLAQEVQRLEADLATAYSDHLHDLARLTAHAGRTEIERDQWRTKAHQLAAELLLRDERKETPC